MHMYILHMYVYECMYIPVSPFVVRIYDFRTGQFVWDKQLEVSSLKKLIPPLSLRLGVVLCLGLRPRDISSLSCQLCLLMLLLFLVYGAIFRGHRLLEVPWHPHTLLWDVSWELGTEVVPQGSLPERCSTTVQLHCVQLLFSCIILRTICIDIDRVPI